VAASNAEREAATTHHEATVANVAAAEATEAQVKAAEHARNARALADDAAHEAAQAFRAAERTKAEAEAANAEAVSAATQATTAVRASYAARQSAAGIADPANTAISIVAPFTGTDLEADFVAEVAEQARKVGAEQAQAAAARAAEAIAAAEAAARAAAVADEQVKPAYEAAAAAARSAADAAGSAAEAQTAAAEAAIDGAEARAAGARASQADAQAREDAILARQAANAASNHAAIAGRAASAAEADAAAARSAASAAEADAAAARDSASAAEADATRAETAAANAQKHAEAAATAAKNALQHARDAQQAFERAEAAERAAELERQRQKADQIGNTKGALTPTEIEVLCGNDAETAKCVEEYENNLESAAAGIVEFLQEHGADFLAEFINVDDIKACFTEGDIGACIWTLIGLIPWAKIGSAIKALGRMIPKIGGFLDKINDARKGLDDVAEALLSCPIEFPEIPEFSPGSGGGGSAVSGFVVMADKKKPKACPVIPKGVTFEIKGLFMGRGNPRRDDNGVHKKWRGDTDIQNPDKPGQYRKVTEAEKDKWGGSWEYDVPGAVLPGRTRLLVNCKNGKCVYGWTDSHYWKIHEFPKLPEVPGGPPPPPGG